MLLAVVAILSWHHGINPFTTLTSTCLCHDFFRILNNVNKKVIAVFVLTLVAIGVLWAYSFGPLSGVVTIQANPASLKPTTQQAVVAQKDIAFNVYHSKDLAENFYTIKFPQTWQLQPNSSAGSYHFSFDNGTGSAELQDVSDNTTLELFVLSQQEPSMKKTVAGYSRVNYQKISVNGNDAYQLTYQSTTNGTTYETTKTYITGKDHAAVVTLTALQGNYSNLQPLFASILGGFQWENK